VAEFRRSDDAEALKHAHALLENQAIHQGFELWEGPRRLHREFVDPGNTAKDGAIKTGM
jgi:hypothetical protein